MSRTPPRAYITRHVRLPRALDVELRQLAERYRRRFNDLLVLILEDWLEEHRDDPSYGPLDFPPRRRQPRKPPRKP